MTRCTTGTLLASLMASTISWPAGCESGDEDGRIRASGTFEVEMIKILSPASGELLEFPVQEGDSIQADQLVASLDTTDLELKRNEVEAALSMARSKLALVKRGARPEDIKQLKALGKEVKLQKKLADTNYARTQKLHDKGTVSQSTLDEVQTTRDVVTTKLSQVKWQLAKAKNGALPEEVDMASASVDQLQAGLDQLDELIADRQVTSPATGTVMETFVNQGELVSVGQLLATVADLSVMELVVYVTEKDLPLVKPGQKALVNIDAFEDRSFDATVSHIASEAEFTPSTVQTREERVKLVFEVTLRVPNPDGYFKAGLPADVVFQEED